ncbi:MAG: hypothetical protein Hyperionvirus2_116 [Hyperionvirus sp.]|uniref:Uncharacterized protein n=1 Tax=Hyperionvirus sp. TaxID=2487770 RepID=A0A3G5A6E6_9VIRU|nr:MAG: hypothetical protein Hyperionvirus2_116 [Hyperionvirus sp.]
MTDTSFELKHRSKFISNITEQESYERTVPEALKRKGIRYTDDLKDKLFYDVQPWEKRDFVEPKCNEISLKKIGEKPSGHLLMGFQRESILFESMPSFYINGTDGIYGVLGSQGVAIYKKLEGNYGRDLALFEFILTPNENTRVGYVNQTENQIPGKYDTKYDIILFNDANYLKITPSAFKINEFTFSTNVAALQRIYQMGNYWADLGERSIRSAFFDCMINKSPPSTTATGGRYKIYKLKSITT